MVSYCFYDTWVIQNGVVFGTPLTKHPIELFVCLYHCYAPYVKHTNNNYKTQTKEELALKDRSTISSACIQTVFCHFPVLLLHLLTACL